MLGLIKTSIGTKFVSRWNDLMCGMALEAVQIVKEEEEEVESDIVMGAKNKSQIDIKRYARVEKVPGGEIEDSRVIKGIMLNKDVVHAQMRRRIEKPRVVLLDCSLEYKKGESQTNIEITKESDWSRILEIEEEQVRIMCEHIASVKPDLVFTEKGISDLAQHYLVKNGISAIRRLKKMDNNRLARATGATIVTTVSDLKPTDVGTKCGLFEVRKIGDEYFTFLEECENPKACTIMLRGPSKDTLNEIERNLQDAMSVARNVLLNPLLCPGGGASEMALSVLLTQRSKSSDISGIEQLPFLGVAEALEVIPRTLIQNCGGNAIKVLTTLRAKHSEVLSSEEDQQAQSSHTWGVDGETGKVVDMKTFGIWEPFTVKMQTVKTAIELFGPIWNLILAITRLTSSLFLYLFTRLFGSPLGNLIWIRVYSSGLLLTTASSGSTYSCGLISLYTLLSPSISSSCSSPSFSSSFLSCLFSVSSTFPSFSPASAPSFALYSCSTCSSRPLSSSLSRFSLAKSEWYSSNPSSSDISI
ncbi:T-complex protein 1 subunit gamma [Zancudomyces culisetae]|uniref:T-complex protein 1 subunit gamma n=1 Tax=Zancudomyces culisetae TaxID=1213189 RepID=A0A1R1PJH7_ZANCU|nr:T-complex protein 1 subunit gamma [Zancudomyces culisetae]|eukprot:OMH81120.1 T-complex protein 1 subunit gamma [Zancudomyces culisetae]